MSEEQPPIDLPSLSSDQVAHYLQQHPDFFHNHLSLLEDLSIPHPSGNAISLISKQLEIFRHKHDELENQLTSLIGIARDNDTSLNKMHELTLALMESKTIEQAVINLDKVFSDCFLTEYSSLRIIKNNTQLPMSNIFVHSDDENLMHFDKILTSNKPKCGRPTLPQARFLFGESAFEVRSCAIIPMSFTEIEGVIAIGSKDAKRFQYSMGHLFLTQMSEVIATRLIALID